MEVRVANARNRCSATLGASARLSASAGSSSPCASTAVLPAPLPALRADDLLMDDEFFPSLIRAVYYNRSGDPIGLWQRAILHSEDNAIWCPRQRCGYRGDKAQFYKLKLVRPML
jgi:hypothetical protein